MAGRGASGADQSIRGGRQCLPHHPSQRLALSRATSCPTGFLIIYRGSGETAENCIDLFLLVFYIFVYDCFLHESALGSFDDGLRRYLAPTTP